MSRPLRGFHVLFTRQLKLTPWWAMSPAVHAVLLMLALILTPEPADSRPSARLAVEFGPAVPELKGEATDDHDPEIIEEFEIVEGEVVLDECVVDALSEEAPLFDAPIGAGIGVGAGSTPFVGPSTNAAIGIGGGAGGAFGGRRGSSGGLQELLVIEADEAEATPPPTYRGRPITEGTLFARSLRDRDLGTCPLKKTTAKAAITAFLARVALTQEFENPFRDKIHAVYVFPLPRNAAVSDFILRVGDREVRGMVRERGEARRIYEAAKRRGQTAALLSQDRPNIFVQEVANLMPGHPIDVSLTYLHPLRIRDGAFEFVFPMVVGERYTPAGSGGSGVTPPAQPRYARTGTNVSVEVALDAGVDLESVECPTHAIVAEPAGNSKTVVRLADRDEIPNRDFVLRYRVAGDDAKFGLLAHRDRLGGFFAFFATPKREVAPEEVMPREMVFVLDCSGSMNGAPLAKSKAVVRRCLTTMNPRDTFRLLRFSNQASGMAEVPLPATPANVERALAYLEETGSGGGTEMIEGIRAALGPEPDPEHLRIVCFLTDGNIGNEAVILSHVERLRRGARLFSFGVGSSVNRYLLDKLAQAGRGAVQYVLPDTPAEKAANRFHRRLAAPFLTDLEIDWGGLPVHDVYPSRIPDLYEGMPILVVGRYRGGGSSTLTLRGRRGGRPFEEEIPVDLPEWSKQNEILAPVWARCRVESIMDRSWHGLTKRMEDRIIDIGTYYSIVTPFTSFVAVDDGAAWAGDGRTVVVAVPMPDGVSYSGVFGPSREFCELRPLGLRLEMVDGKVVVAHVGKDSPAATAGIESGDVVLAVNGKSVTNGREAEVATGDRLEGLTLGIRRQGCRLDVEFEPED